MWYAKRTLNYQRINSKKAKYTSWLGDVWKWGWEVLMVQYRSLELVLHNGWQKKWALEEDESSRLHLVFTNGMRLMAELLCKCSFEKSDHEVTKIKLWCCVTLSRQLWTRQTGLWADTEETITFGRPAHDFFSSWHDSNLLVTENWEWKSDNLFLRRYNSTT